MATENPTYDLMLLLDPAAEEDRRAKILKDTRDLLIRDGEIVSSHDWGLRPTAYEIDKKAEAEYHLLQFHGGRDLLASVERILRITDGVKRFRIIKAAPHAPSPPDLKVSATPAAPAASEDEDRGRDRDEEPTPAAS